MSNAALRLGQLEIPIIPPTIDRADNCTHFRRDAVGDPKSAGKRALDFGVLKNSDIADHLAVPYVLRVRNHDDF